MNGFTEFLQNNYDNLLSLFHGSDAAEVRKELDFEDFALEIFVELLPN